MREALVSCCSGRLQGHDVLSGALLNCGEESFAYGQSAVMATHNLLMSMHVSKPLLRCQHLGNLAEPFGRYVLPDNPSTFAATASVLIVACRNGRLLVWSLLTGALVKSFMLAPEYSGEISQLIITADQQLLVVVVGQYALLLSMAEVFQMTDLTQEWIEKTVEPLAVYKAMDRITAVAVADSLRLDLSHTVCGNPLVKNLYVADASGLLLLWNSTAGVKWVVDFLERISSLLFVEDSNRLIVSCEKLSVCELDVLATELAYLRNGCLPLPRENVCQKWSAHNLPETLQGIEVRVGRRAALNAYSTLLAMTTERGWLIIWDCESRVIKSSICLDQQTSACPDFVAFVSVKPQVLHICQDLIPPKMPDIVQGITLCDRLQTSLATSGGVARIQDTTAFYSLLDRLTFSSLALRFASTIGDWQSVDTKAMWTSPAVDSLMEAMNCVRRINLMKADVQDAKEQLDRYERYYDKLREQYGTQPKPKTPEQPRGLAYSLYSSVNPLIGDQPAQKHPALKTSYFKYPQEWEVL